MHGEPSGTGSTSDSFSVFGTIRVPNFGICQDAVYRKIGSEKLKFRGVLFLMVEGMLSRFGIVPQKALYCRFGGFTHASRHTKDAIGPQKRLDRNVKDAYDKNPYLRNQ